MKQEADRGQKRKKNDNARYDMISPDKFNCSQNWNNEFVGSLPEIRRTN